MSTSTCQCVHETRIIDDVSLTLAIAAVSSIETPISVVCKHRQHNVFHELDVYEKLKSN